MRDHRCDAPLEGDVTSAVAKSLADRMRGDVGVVLRPGWLGMAQRWVGLRAASAASVQVRYRPVAGPVRGNQVNLGNHQLGPSILRRLGTDPGSTSWPTPHSKAAGGMRATPPIARSHARAHLRPRPRTGENPRAAIPPNPDGSRPGDWVCGRCGDLQFARTHARGVALGLQVVIVVPAHMHPSRVGGLRSRPTCRRCAPWPPRDGGTARRDA